MRDVRQVFRTPHPPEIHVGVVCLASMDQPLVPPVAPLATGPQLLWQTLAASDVRATAIVVVTIEVPAGVTWKLLCASICEESLTCSWNLDVEAVVPIHIIPNVCDLQNHAFVHKVRMRTSPISIFMDFVHKLELEALTTVSVAKQAMAAAHCYRSITHTESFSDDEWLIIGTRSCMASSAC